MTNNRKWFFHFVRNSTGQRKGRVIVASAAVAVAAAVVIAALGLSLGIRQQLGSELKSYGANVIVSKADGYIDGALTAQLPEIEGVEGFKAQLYGSAFVGDRHVELIGMTLDATRDWKLSEGNHIQNNRQVLIGTDLAEALAIKPGDVIEIRQEGTIVPVTVSGTVQRGGPEDKSVILALNEAQALAGLEDSISAVLVRTAAERIDTAAAALRILFPDAEVKTIRQVAYAEQSFLGKIELLMSIVTFVVIIASAISVSSTMGATILERMKEIGLMRAIGGTRAQIGRFFISEAALIGLIAGSVGYLLGIAASQAVSQGAFGSFIDTPFWLVGISLALGVTIAIGASYFPMRRALMERPSVILRGE